MTLGPFPIGTGTIILIRAFLKDPSFRVTLGLGSSTIASQVGGTSILTLYCTSHCQTRKNSALQHVGVTSERRVIPS